MWFYFQSFTTGPGWEKQWLGRLCRALPACSSPLGRDFEEWQKGAKGVNLKNHSDFPHLSAKSDTSRVEFWARRLSATPLIFVAQSTDRAPLGPMSLIAP